MHKITFYPLGNADSCMVELENGKNLLFDFANFGAAENDDDLRINLGEALKDKLNESDNEEFDIVAFTHGDDDHVHGASEFFYFEHAKKYQSDDRIKIKELWVPAAMVLDIGNSDDARVLRAEARYRLKNGKGVRVFSKPDKLKKWLEDQDIDWEERKHLITDAGQIVPGFSFKKDKLELFIHSPFAAESDGEEIDRNKASLIMHATFRNDKRDTKLFYVGDTTHDVLVDIINITKKKKNEGRLEWDVFKVPHHCSYLALNSEKGKDETVPVDEIKWLLEKGNKYSLLISSSNVIPDNDDNNDPPHRQAAKCYRKYAKNIDGNFKVTMEQPSKKKPKPLVVEINDQGAKILKSAMTGAITYTSTHRTPRAG